MGPGRAEGERVGGGPATRGGGGAAPRRGWALGGGIRRGAMPMVGWEELGVVSGNGEGPVGTSANPVRWWTAGGMDVGGRGNPGPPSATPPRGRSRLFRGDYPLGTAQHCGSGGLREGGLEGAGRRPPGPETATDWPGMPAGRGGGDRT